MQNQPVLNRLDLKITLSVLITIGLSWIIPWLSPLPAAISALLCVQGQGVASLKAGWNRLLATLIGGILGAIVALTYTKWQAYWLLFLQLLVTIFLTLWLSKIVKLPPFISRIAVLTLLVVIYVGEDHSLAYVVYRWLATLVGAVVAWLVSLSLKND